MRNKSFINNYLPKEKIGVIGMKLLSIIFLCSYSYVNAQPLWEGLSVDKFYRENKEIYQQKFENGIKYFSDKKERENHGLSQGMNILVYKKDTMKIYIEPIPHHLIMGVKRVYFKKGEYTIDLKKCVSDNTLKIEKFPHDCLIYRKEEERKE